MIVILKGEKITIGSKIRFIDETELYINTILNRPEIGKVYTVSGFSPPGGFYLEEIKNKVFNWLDDQGNITSKAEPGFATWRFEPIKKNSNKKIVNIKIEFPIEEKLDIELV
jgi:hypothetical protein